MQFVLTITCGFVLHNFVTNPFMAVFFTYTSLSVVLQLTPFIISFACVAAYHALNVVSMVLENPYGATHIHLSMGV